MSLTSIVLAFWPVAAVFWLVGWISAVALPDAAEGPHAGAPRPPTGGRLRVAGAAVLIAEALVLTLLAALWFGSLGHGGWPLLFFLLGLLAGGADRALRWALGVTPGRRELARFGFGVVKYLLAGAILAWRLG